MKIILITKSKIKDIPPLISVAHIMADLGHDVEVITSEVNLQLAESFIKKNIKYVEFPFASATSPIKKVYEYYMFRKKVFNHLKNTEFDLLWIEGAHTIRSLGEGIKEFKYVPQISELHTGHTAQLKAIGKVIHNAVRVVMPEYNRTVIYKTWFKLKIRPTVLPNKPYIVPNKELLKNLKKKIFNNYIELKEKKIILYQGLIDRDRDLSNFIKAVKELGEDYIFVMVGKDGGMVEHYKKIDNNIVHIDFMPVPDYFVFTANAHIGILSYDSNILNNAYCAPNKIYEYGYFALPMIGNDIPGLKYSIKSSKAGIIVDEEDITSIKNAIQKIDADYENYSKASKDLFDKCDNRTTINEIIRSIKN